jgi:hypothetical protein
VDPGDPIPFRADLYTDDPDAGGVLTNAASVALTIILPDGSTVTPSVTNPPAVTGKYRYDYQTTTASLTGEYTGSWAFTNPNSAYRESYDIGTSLVSVNEALRHLRAVGVIKGVVDLDELQWLCFVASNAVEADLDRVVAKRTVTETYDGNVQYLVLRSTPVISITSVLENGVSLDVASNVTLDRNSGILWRGLALNSTVFGWGRQNITVTYVAGMQQVPYFLRKVVLSTVQAMWRDSQQAPNPGMAAYAASPEFVDTGALTKREQDAYDSLRGVGIG